VEAGDNLPGSGVHPPRGAAGAVIGGGHANNNTSFAGVTLF
jgi:hypothetical protein